MMSPHFIDKATLRNRQCYKEKHVSYKSTNRKNILYFRKNSDIPRGAIVTNYNRVLILPRVRVEDQGEYMCRAYNDKVSITGSVTLSIQAR